MSERTHRLVFETSDQMGRNSRVEVEVTSPFTDEHDDAVEQMFHELRWLTARIGPVVSGSPSVSSSGGDE